MVVGFQLLVISFPSWSLASATNQQFFSNCSQLISSLGQKPATMFQNTNMLDFSFYWFKQDVIKYLK